MGDARTTITGNLTSDPTLRHTASGQAVANFSLAEGRQRFDRDSGAYVDADTLFMRVTAWGQLAENIAESVRKGDRVTVEGRLVPQSYTAEDGSERRSVDISADDVSVALQWATVTITRNPRRARA